MENKQPLVSAIVSTYKSEKYIRGKIEDLLKQTVGDSMEIIIVNSGSPQNEDAIIKEYLPCNPNIKYIHTEERETIYKAWNRGIKAASGKYITNSNTDDRLKKDAFEIMIDVFEKNPDVYLLYADQVVSELENEDYEHAAGNNVIKFPDYSIMKLLNRAIIGSQPIWRASLNFEDNIWFDDSFEVCGDHDFELAVAHKYKIMHLPVALGTFYKSPSRSNKEYENIGRNVLELNRLRQKHIQYYLNSVTSEVLDEKLKELRIYLLMPFPLYAMIAKILDVLYKKRFYRPMLIYSVDFFASFYCAGICKLGNNADAARIEKRYLRFLKIKNNMIKVRNNIRKYYAAG